MNKSRRKDNTNLQVYKQIPKYWSYKSIKITQILSDPQKAMSLRKPSTEKMKKGTSQLWSRVFDRQSELTTDEKRLSSYRDTIFFNLFKVWDPKAWTANWKRSVQMYMNNKENA